MGSLPAPAKLLGIGTALPPQAFSQEATCEALIESLGFDRHAARRVRAVYRRSRIERRFSVLSTARHPLSLFGEGRRVGTAERMALYAEHAPSLALEACRSLFADPRLPRPERVSHVLVASCTGFLAPGLDVQLCRRLELSPRVGRTLIGFQGCQAGLSALRVADAIARADAEACVLIACVELSTLHFQASGEDDALLGGSLFSDGAAAALVAGSGVGLTGPSSGRPLVIERCASALHPDSLTEMTWEVGDEGFVLHLSRLLPRLVGLDFAPFIAEELGLDDEAARAEVAWAVHPGGSAILDAVEQGLALPKQALDASRRVLSSCGNMSSATIFFVLDSLMKSEEPPERLVALAFGPGLSLEATLLRRSGTRGA